MDGLIDIGTIAFPNALLIEDEGGVSSQSRLAYVGQKSLRRDREKLPEPPAGLFNVLQSLVDGP